MKKLFAVIALAITIPGVAHAQSAPEAAPKMACCETMKDKCACCAKMADKTPAGQQAPPADDPHAGHDMSPSPSPAPDGGHSQH